MLGTNATTGKPLENIAHLVQSVRDILLTPLGSRVMRPNYGSRLFELVDAPLNSATLLAIYSETAQALKRWEPRIKIKRVYATAVDTGRVELVIEGKYLPDGTDVTVEGIQVR
jgi:phage baseplate assembly protein W